MRGGGGKILLNDPALCAGQEEGRGKGGGGGGESFSKKKHLGVSQWLCVCWGRWSEGGGSLMNIENKALTLVSSSGLAHVKQNDTKPSKGSVSRRRPSPFR